MNPGTWLCERSSMWSVERAQISEGILPLKKLDHKAKIKRDGMFPENLLSPRSRLSKALQFCSWEGSSPEWLLLDSTKNLSAVRETIDLGIMPERLLFDILAIYREDISFQIWGISPDKLFLEITKVIKAFRLPIDKGMLSFREFQEISKSVRMGITSPMFWGIGPENKLLLKYSVLTLKYCWYQVNWWWIPPSEVAMKAPVQMLEFGLPASLHKDVRTGCSGTPSEAQVRC